MSDLEVADSREATGRTGDTVTFAPIDLDEAPAVDALLRRLGLGPFDRDGLSAPTGRNDVWAGSTASGDDVVVKRLSGEPEDVAARLGRSLAFERFVEGIGPGRVRAPRFLGADAGADAGAGAGADAGLCTLIATSAAGRGFFPARDMDEARATALARAATPGLLEPFLVRRTEDG